MRHLATWIKERGLLLANLALFATFFVCVMLLRLFRCRVS